VLEEPTQITLVTERRDGKGYRPQTRHIINIHLHSWCIKVEVLHVEFSGENKIKVTLFMASLCTRTA
jgi:hypothetical protein